MNKQDESILIEFGESVRAQRKKIGISQEELSFRSGLNKNYISDVERGTRNVSLKAISAFAEGLETTVVQLFKK